MKKRILSVLLVLSMLSFCMVNANAQTKDPYQDAIKIRCTCYTGYNKTYTGKQPYDGCRIIAGKKEWLGSVAALYSVKKDGSKGNFLGYYEVADTGSAKSLNNGTSIDLWRTDLDEAQDWVEVIGDYVYMELIKGEG